MTASTNIDESLTMVNDCKNYHSKLSESEYQFIKAIGYQLIIDVPLTDSQEKTLSFIWHKVQTKMEYDEYIRSIGDCWRF